MHIFIYHGQKCFKKIRLLALTLTYCNGRPLSIDQTHHFAMINLLVLIERRRLRGLAATVEFMNVQLIRGGLDCAPKQEIRSN